MVSITRPGDGSLRSGEKGTSAVRPECFDNACLTSPVLAVSLLFYFSPTNPPDPTYPSTSTHLTCSQVSSSPPSLAPLCVSQSDGPPLSSPRIESTSSDPRASKAWRSHPVHSLSLYASRRQYQSRCLPETSPTGPPARQLPQGHYLCQPVRQGGIFHVHQRCACDSVGPPCLARLLLVLLRPDLMAIFALLSLLPPLSFHNRPNDKCVSCRLSISPVVSLDPDVVLLLYSSTQYVLIGGGTYHEVVNITRKAPLRLLGMNAPHSPSPLGALSLTTAPSRHDEQPCRPRREPSRYLERLLHEPNGSSRHRRQC